MSTCFLGEYHHVVDKKGRMSVPAKFRPGLGDIFFLVRGSEKCLYAYPAEEWNRIVEHMRTSESFTKKSSQKFLRKFYSSAGEIEIDAMGRILIPNNLRDEVGFTDKTDVAVIGVANRVEIWSAEAWAAYCVEDEEDLDIGSGMEIFDI